MATKAVCYDQYGKPFTTQRFGGKEVAKIGGNVIRRSPSSPNPAVLVNARTYVEAVDGTRLSMDKVRSPIMVILEVDGAVLPPFWIPPMEAGDQEELIQSTDLQRVRYVFSNPIR